MNRAALALGALALVHGTAWAGQAQLSGVEPVVRSPLAPGEAPVDAVVASMEVEGDEAPQFVLASEFELLLRMELLVRGAPDALHVAVDESVRGPVLEQLVGERLVVREAERSGEGAPDPARLHAERRWLLDRMAPTGGADALLAATGATAEELDLLIRQRVVATQYLVAHNPRSIEPSEVDLRRTHQSGRFAALYPDGASLAVARRVLREALVRSSLPAAERLFYRALGSRVRVRVFVASGAAEGA